MSFSWRRNKRNIAVPLVAMFRYTITLTHKHTDTHHPHQHKIRTHITPTSSYKRTHTHAHTRTYRHTRARHASGRAHMHISWKAHLCVRTFSSQLRAECGHWCLYKGMRIFADFWRVVWCYIAATSRLRRVSLFRIQSDDQRPKIQREIYSR